MDAIPDTIVLIHGFWVTPRSWEDWKARYESRGYRVLTPAYPGFEVEVEALNADPTPIEDLTVPAVVEHLESVVSEIEPAPILMGHSAGGVFTQLLMDRGYGAAGVADQLGADRGRQARAAVTDQVELPVLKNPANRHKAVGFTFEQWRYAFTNTFSEEEARRLYERYHIPASGRVFWSSALANIHPGPDDTHVDYKNPNRAPLLFISGSEDHLMPPSIQRSNAKHYKAEGTITESRRVRGPRAPHALADRLGGDRRLRPRLGGRARKAPATVSGDDDARVAGGGRGRIRPSPGFSASQGPVFGRIEKHSGARNETSERRGHPTGSQRVRRKPITKVRGQVRAGCPRRPVRVGSGPGGPALPIVERDPPVAVAGKQHEPVGHPPFPPEGEHVEGDDCLIVLAEGRSTEHRTERLTYRAMPIEDRRRASSPTLKGSPG